MCIRDRLYSALDRPVYYLPVELLHGVTYSCFSAASVVHVAAVAPPGTEVTAQGVLRGAQVGVGGALGALVCGFVSDRVGIAGAFRYIGLAAIPAAGVALGLGRALRGEDPQQARLARDEVESEGVLNSHS